MISLPVRLHFAFPLTSSITPVRHSIILIFLGSTILKSVAFQRRKRSNEMLLIEVALRNIHLTFFFYIDFYFCCSSVLGLLCLPLHRTAKARLPPFLSHHSSK